MKQIQAYSMACGCDGLHVWFKYSWSLSQTVNQIGVPGMNAYWGLGTKS